MVPGAVVSHALNMDNVPPRTVLVMMSVVTMVSTDSEPETVIVWITVLPGRVVTEPGMVEMTVSPGRVVVCAGRVVEE